MDNSWGSAEATRRITARFESLVNNVQSIRIGLVIQQHDAAHNAAPLLDC